MDKKNKGLADNQEGEFILNESGTSVNTDNVETETKRNSGLDDKYKSKEDSQKSQSSTEE
jgi:hypothetical protein